MGAGQICMDAFAWQGCIKQALIPPGTGWRRKTFKIFHAKITNHLTSAMTDGSTTIHHV